VCLHGLDGLDALDAGLEDAGGSLGRVAFTGVESS